jgi:thiamine-monophosphate kinase
MNEKGFIAQLREMVTHPAARGLLDDAALLEVGGARLIITHDMLVEGVHFLPDDPAESVAWKLLAVNLSDLAAKGVRPAGAVMAYTLVGQTALAETGWDAAFVTGLGAALAHFGVPLIGGDTVLGTERSLGMTLIGEAIGPVPSRAGAVEGDALFVTGTIGDAGIGLALARAGRSEPEALLEAYRRPQPQLAAGKRLAPKVSAMMDVSDGLLIDVLRMTEASGVSAIIDLDAVPLSAAALSESGEGRATRLAAATAGDDYQLLFTSSLPLPPLPCPVTRIGQIARGAGVHVHDRDGAVPLPAQLGWLHGS